VIPNAWNLDTKVKSDLFGEVFLSQSKISLFMTASFMFVHDTTVQEGGVMSDCFLS